MAKMQFWEDSMHVVEKMRKLPHLITALPGPRAQEIVARDQQVISPSYTRDYPLVAKSGQGAMVEDVDGNTFLDFAAGIAVVATGHCHPEVVAAIQKQASELIHMSCTDFYYEDMIEFAEKIVSVTPGEGPKKVYFGNSGTEAVEAAMKLARYHTRRDKFIAFHGCFHGRTLGSLSLTASKAVQRKRFGSLLGGVFHTPYPNTYRGAYGVRPEHAAADALAYMESELFKHIVDPEEVAAIFVEPIQGEGGYVVAPPEFLKGLKALCRRYGILLVVDEVQSGMGRTGKWWASEHADIEPDILLTAKGIASGMPLGAMIARAELMDWTPGAHASTFGGNPVCVAAALATFSLLEKSLIANAAQLGEFIAKRMADWRDRHKSVGDIRGKGLMMGIELVRDHKTKEPAPDLRNQVIHMAFARGLLVLGAGDSSLRLAPPLVIDEEQADFAIRTLDQCIGDAERSL
jgi:4-aminobutyrate aminotransferase